MAAGHLGVIERHLGSRTQPSVIRAVTPRLTGTCMQNPAAVAEN